MAPGANLVCIMKMFPLTSSHKFICADNMGTKQNNSSLFPVLSISHLWPWKVSLPNEIVVAKKQNC